MKRLNVEYSLVKEGFKENITRNYNSITFYYPSEEYNVSSPYYVALPPGKYKFECWGGRGFYNSFAAYTSGIITLHEKVVFYLYLGASGIDIKPTSFAYNGGGYGDSTGGGATDIRLIGGEWDNFASLKSRIMVAAGAGSFDMDGNGGSGGDLIGKTARSSFKNGTGGTQAVGGIGYSHGSFGKGGFSVRYDENGKRLDNAGGCGGGYYGGGTGEAYDCCGGGGGSSFISGHEGCDAITENSTETNITHTRQPLHYSGLYFKDTQMIAGHEIMPLPNGMEGEGYLDSGCVRISSDLPLPFFELTCKKEYKSSISIAKIGYISILIDIRYTKE